jgi:hypothetical protein
LAIDPATGLEVRKLLRPEMIQILMPRDATVPANPSGGSQQHRQFAISFRSCLFTASPATLNRYCLIHSFVQLQHFSFALLTLTFFWPQSRRKNGFGLYSIITYLHCRYVHGQIFSPHWLVWWSKSRAP